MRKPVSFVRFSFALVQIALLTQATVLPSLAAHSRSASYQVSHQILDQGGGRSGSGHYSNHGSIGGFGETAVESEKYLMRSGFIAQIHDAPFVKIEAVDNLSRTEGTLRGFVNPNSLKTESWFEFGPAGDLSEIFPLSNLEEKTIAEAVSAIVSELDPGTDYEFRLAASNLDGTVQSPIIGFSTIVNLPPTADTITLERLRNLSTKLLVSELLAGATDPANDPISLGNVATGSANGGQGFLSGGWLLYQPAAGFNEADSFTYTIRDNFGAESTGTISIVVQGEGNAPTLNVRSIEVLPNSEGKVR